MKSARLMLVGEQPGDKEDIEGHPFVGPAGHMLDKALEEAGLQRHQVYLTNAVKHFRFTQRGKRRLHKRPDADEIEACRWWLDLELQFVKPAVVVTLGATALRSVLGKATSISRLRSTVIELEGGCDLIATVHPSFLLRIPDKDKARREFVHFVDDLKLACRTAGET